MTNKLDGLYVILARNGFTFGSLGMNYVIVQDGEIVMEDMNKTLVERKFMEMSRR